MFFLSFFQVPSELLEKTNNNGLNKDKQYHLPPSFLSIVKPVFIIVLLIKTVYIINTSMSTKNGAPDETRTHNLLLLKQTGLPVSLQGH